ncbi:MAG: hypothetical protein MJ168_08345 [Clostridia bacterium]|nr:hypothetical protein [Clostridia bacterium]
MSDKKPKYFCAFIDGDSVSGKAYENLIKYLCRKSDCMSFDVFADVEERAKAIEKGYDVNRSLNEEETKYLYAINKTKRYFLNHIIRKETGRYMTTYYVSLKHINAEKKLLNADSIQHWNYPDDVENLCFYKNGVCTFCSVTHEDYFAFYTDDETEVEELEKMSCATIHKKISPSDDILKKI